MSSTKRPTYLVLVTLVSMALGFAARSEAQSASAFRPSCGPDIYPAQVSRVVDGDTLELVIDLGLGVYTREMVRLRSIDTPEVHGPKQPGELERGRAATAFTREWTSRAGGRVEIAVDQDKARGKYGRLIVDVWLPGVDEPLAVALEKAGHAK